MFLCEVIMGKKSGKSIGKRLGQKAKTGVVYNTDTAEGKANFAHDNSRFDYEQSGQGFNDVAGKSANTSILGSVEQDYLLGKKKQLETAKSSILGG